MNENYQTKARVDKPVIGLLGDGIRPFIIAAEGGAAAGGGGG